MISDFDDFDYPYVPSPGTLGSTHSISGDLPEKDVVELLREVVEEVTRKPLPKAGKKIGFY